MRRSITIPLLIIVALALLPCACQRRIDSSASPEPSFERRGLAFDGLQRSYDLWVPETVDASRPSPLVLVLHGGGGNPEQACRMQGGVAALAAAEGFVVACPAGVEGHWNDGRKIEDYRAQRKAVDDVGFLKAVVAAVADEAAVDRRRVYVTGLSNGGMMTLRLACQAGDTFAAAAAVIANLPADLACQPAGPVPVMIMNGSDDPLMPWDGGQVHFLRRKLGSVMSAEQTAEFWAGVDGCDMKPQVDALPDVDPSDGTRAELYTYTGCAGGVSVELVAVLGGGHGMPGGDQYAPAFLVGRVSQDLDGAQVIWTFLSRFSLPHS